MPGLVKGNGPAKRLKRASDSQSRSAHLKKQKTSSDLKQDIQQLEASVQEGRFNDIVKILQISRESSAQHRAAAISLCKIFCRLLSQGRLAKTKTASNDEVMVTEWLRKRFAEYKAILDDLICTDRAEDQDLGLTLCMQILKVELENATSLDTAWRSGIFRLLLSALLKSSALPQYRTDYFNKFDDVRFYTFTSIAEDASGESQSNVTARFVENGIELLKSSPPLPEDGKLSSFFFKPPKAKDAKQKPAFTKVAAHQKQAQRAWLALLGSREMTLPLRKQILQTMTKTVVPFFQEPIRLMDFLSDCFNQGGSMALLALSGMYEMMTKFNLDYPSFYNKLYSLLNDDILHSAHRSTFFRLLNEFLSSTHVPAIMISSFIKKLSRLALHAPPAAIVAVVPLVYNLLYEHRSCTFMIHREPRTDEERQLIELEGADDPFKPDEPDPMETSAIDSCLWELIALQNHFHPNVSSLAGILSEQFTKPSYNLEDFLDHSYNGLISSELHKQIKKPPVVEFEIPKKVFTIGPEDARLDSMLEQIMTIPR